MDVVIQNDFYCEQVIPGKIQVKVMVESSNILAFFHTNPFWEVHIVIIPKKHISSLTNVSKAEQSILNELIQIASEVCTEVEKTHGGCRLSTNCGNYQSNKHLHFYVHAGKRIRSEDGTPLN